MRDRVTLNIADVRISVETRAAVERDALLCVYGGFVTDEEPDLHLESARVPSLPDPPPGRTMLFDTGTTWSAWLDSGALTLELRAASTGSPVFRRISLSSDLGTGRILTLQDPALGLRGEEIQPDPLSFPLSEVLLMIMLPGLGGVLTHACGVSLDKGSTGLLFPGNSGAGKSTIASVWDTDDEASVMNDDRVVVRRSPEGFNIHGTPWSGDYPVRSADSVPLKSVCFLRHARENTLSPLSSVEAAAGMLSRSFLPFWDATGMESTLQFLDRLASSVRFYDLGFKPDQSVVRFIRDSLL
jgi:hypothetical protein